MEALIDLADMRLHEKYCTDLIKLLEE